MQELYSKPFDRIVSLGSDCRVRYQVSLSLYKRGLGGAAVDMAAFEKALYTRAREATASEGSYFFDWNVSPIEGVISCIRDDFSNVFKEENLSITETGSVLDNATGIYFVHSFSRINGHSTQEIIKTEFAKQKQKVTYLSEKFLDNIRKTDRTLYVRVGENQQEAKEIVAAISDKNAEHNFHVLMVRIDDGESGTEHADQRMTIFRMNSQIDKPQIAHWQGDNVKWGALLDPVVLVKDSEAR